MTEKMVTDNNEELGGEEKLSWNDAHNKSFFEREAQAQEMLYKKMKEERESAEQPTINHLKDEIITQKVFDSTEKKETPVRYTWEKKLWEENGGQPSTDTMYEEKRKLLKLQDSFGSRIFRSNDSFSKTGDVLITRSGNSVDVVINKKNGQKYIRLSEHRGGGDDDRSHHSTKYYFIKYEKAKPFVE